MPHFMMDCYFRDVTKADEVRRESAAVKANGDVQAIAEAKSIASWQNLAWFEVRKVEPSESQIIYSTRDVS
jgi:hypothetical protein